MPVFENLKKIMANKKLSYAALAKMIGRSTMGLHKAINNKTLTVADLLAICTALNITPQELWGSEDTNIVNAPGAVYGASNILDKLRTIQRLAAELEQNLSSNV